MSAPAEDLRAIWNSPVALERWTMDQLDQLDAEQELFSQELEESRRGWERFPIPGIPFSERVHQAKGRARAGHIEPLRRLYPELAEFLHAPPRKRGQRRPPKREVWSRFTSRMHAVDADADAKRIRKIWREKLGKTYRRDPPTADEIAARRNRVPLQQLINFRKSKHR
jgi:hypothetical protein